MFTNVRYSPKQMVFWTRYETFIFLVLSLIVTVLYQVLGLTFLHLPWTPVAVIGTAVAFIISFQNNAAYGRIWEARKIWGGIVNSSRSWGMKIADMVTNEHAKQPVSEGEIQEQQRNFVYRHIAWLTALRHAMRTTRKWEVFDQERSNKEWAEIMYIPERRSTLSTDLEDYLSPEEHSYVMSKGNKPTALLYLQSHHLRRLKEQGLIWEFAFLELEALLEELFTLQGKSERIKNFPYPRQYATLSYYFVWIFIFFLPFATVPEFYRIGQELNTSFPGIASYFVWLAVPFCLLISWVFHTMERIGRVGENPFEGSANDVPISTIARGIEINLREMLDEDPEQIPGPFPEVLDVQM